jgi:hypothetical protein
MATIKYTRACIIDSLYSLFLYLLISSKSDLEKTFFFFSGGVDFSIRKNFPNHFSFDLWDRKNKWLKYLYMVYLRCFSTFRWSFLKKAELFGFDHLYFCPGLIRKRPYTLIEDGLGNYIELTLLKKENLSLKDLFCKIFFGSLSIYGYRLGNNKVVKKIILTGMKDLPPNIDKDKVEIINIHKLFSSLPDDYKSKIISLFNIEDATIKMLKKKKYILFTQTFDVDNIISEREKINIYEKIIKKYNLDDLVIKKHPREKTDYKKYFPDVLVFEKPIPMEIISLLGIRFHTAITISSGSVFLFNYPIQVDWIGTSIHPNIEKRYGIINYVAKDKEVQQNEVVLD